MKESGTRKGGAAEKLMLTETVDMIESHPVGGLGRLIRFVVAEVSDARSEHGWDEDNKVGDERVRRMESFEICSVVRWHC